MSGPLTLVRAVRRYLSLVDDLTVAVHQKNREASEALRPQIDAATDSLRMLVALSPLDEAWEALAEQYPEKLRASFVATRDEFERRAADILEKEFKNS